MLGTDSPGCTKYPCQLFTALAGASSDNTMTDDATDDRVPIHCERIPRLLLSPCHARVVDVGTEMSNRVLRKFLRSDEFGGCSFVRLQVSDESGQQLFGDWSPEVQDHMTKTLLEGVVVNGMKYEFLAYSSSRK